ncbi:MAG TPA: class I SAM-dependent RNA methyltransferase [Pyrinomonadaceae bacterium]|nr:class I SAM-dependent RNA methyltransferase [Pyrinomonadaceae bacterium]
MKSDPAANEAPATKGNSVQEESRRAIEYRSGDVLEVTIERMVPNGFGLAFVPGATVFVALAAPGDRLRIRLTRIKGASAFAEIEAILEPSPDRVPPHCKYFGTCGGCDFQQMPYPIQLSTKAAMLMDSLRRIGKLELGEVPIIASPSQLNYRTRALWRADIASSTLGYYERDSHNIVDIDNCPVLDPRLDAAMQEIRSSIKRGEISGDKLIIEASVGTKGPPSIVSSEAGFKGDEILIEAAGERYLSSAGGFFQGNLSLLDDLIASATGHASGSVALDLYCGVGLFSLPLSRRFASVVGVESDARSIGFAKRNAIAGAATNIDFHISGVGSFLADFEGPADLVLLDPPRAGTEKNVIRNVVRLMPKNVTYVACDAAVLARDLRRLVDGGYKISDLVALDMFPQTHHVEAVARLTRVA